MKVSTLWRALLHGLLCVAFCHPVHAGNKEAYRPTFIAAAPVIDGRLEDEVWASASEATGLMVVEPDLKKPGVFQTRVKMAYDKEALYLGVINEQPAETHVQRTSPRDKKWIHRDAFRVVLDPSGQGRYGYIFEVALGGTLTDGTMRPEWNYSFDWDGPWRAATSADKDHWYAEIEIPWSMMEWPAEEEKRRIGIFFRREVTHLGEYWATPPIPFNAAAFLSDLAKMEIVGINPQGRLTLYPYVAVGYNGISEKRTERTGTDVFWQPSSNLLASATLNPDFGQVESDELVVNFGPIETLLQEKRPFFLEGNDIFQTGSQQTGSQKASGLQLVHTRRIGASADILAAVKMTGQKENLRYGVMAAFEDDSPIGSDFYVGRALYEKKGTGSGYASLGYLGTFAHDGGDDDSWAHSVDAQWQSSDSRYRLETQLVGSDAHGEQGFAWNGLASYTPVSGTEYRLELDYIDDKFDINDVGYMERNDRLKFYTYYKTYHYDLPSLKRLSYSISARGEANDRLLAMTFQGMLYFKFHNLTSLLTEVRYMPPTWDDLGSFGHGDFRREEGYRIAASWRSDESKPFGCYISTRVYSEDNGGLSKRLGVAFEWTPLGMVRIHSFTTYYDREDWILHHEGNEMNGFDAEQVSVMLDSDIRLTPKQEIRIGLQWVGLDAKGKTAYRIDPDGYLVENDRDAASNGFDYAEFSGQIRYKYEFAPLSDLFIVYSRGNLVYLDAASKRENFGDLLSDTLGGRDVDVFLIKVRYRF